MPERRVGLWLIGALGGVGSTVALGLAALRRGLTDRTGMVTALPDFAGLDLDEPAAFVVGGHDIRRGGWPGSVADLARRIGAFDPAVVDACTPDLEAWTTNLRAGTVINSDDTIAALADRPELPRAASLRTEFARLRDDLQQFRDRHRLAQVVVVNVASTEPAVAERPEFNSIEQLRQHVEAAGLSALPVSSVYALASLEAGCPYVNFTPSAGASLPALEELAATRGVPIAGRDGKTGETLVKTVLAPMFARRNLRLLSWVGHNILGNLDGRVLNDPRHKESKVRSKDQVIREIVGYPVQTHTSIEYIESLDDWKTAWDHVHFQGFLGVRMALQFTWQGCDSALAAPLVIDLARLTLLAQRRGQGGVLRHLACFFKSPMGVGEQDFFRQFALLEDYIESVT
ncbi:MAG TPA: inositol-3-phosphate synthase [Gemmataceae bacterium]|nr:inositol-3-phosphate synthase [Gemmataceae bacterium]